MNGVKNNLSNFLKNIKATQQIPFLVNLYLSDNFEDRNFQDLTIKSKTPASRKIKAILSKIDIPKTMKMLALLELSIQPGGLKEFKSKEENDFKGISKDEDGGRFFHQLGYFVEELNDDFESLDQISECESVEVSRMSKID